MRARATRHKSTSALIALLAVGLVACTKAADEPVAITQGSDQQAQAHRRGQANASAMIDNAFQCEPPHGEGQVKACERACKLNHSNSCANWGFFIAYEDPAAASELYRRACKGGSGIGCEAIARVSEDQGLFLEARRYHRVHCAQGYARSCSQLASLLEAGLGGSVDLPTSQMYRKRACLLGRTDDCASETSAQE